MQPPSPSRFELTLCLSGGGFRATIFHAGTLAALRAMGFLPRVRHIVSVSGGSIVAAHATLNWARYIDSNEDVFRAAVRELLATTSLDVRGRILRRWLFLGTLPRYRRVNQLVRFYDRLYGGTRLEDLAGGGRPKLYIAATSLVSGRRVYFSSDGLHYDALDGTPSINLPELPLAKAVAASSAFPPMFPPLVLDPKVLKVNMHLDRLTDAGVYDNLGILAGSELAADGELLISDASAAFGSNSWSKYWLTLGRNVRTTDILMSRIAELDKKNAGAGVKTNVHVASISDTVSDDQLRQLPASIDPAEPLALTPALQKYVAQVRTDLDVFLVPEVQALFRHGYTVAANAFGRLATRQSDPGSPALIAKRWWDPTSADTRFTDSLKPIARARRGLMSHIRATVLGPQRPEPKTPDQWQAVLEKAGSRRWGIWNRRDPFCWLLLAVLAAIVVYLVITTSSTPASMTLSASLSTASKRMLPTSSLHDQGRRLDEHEVVC